MNDNDAHSTAIEELRGENEALRRSLLILIDSLPDTHRDAIRQDIARSIPEGDIDNPRRGAYHNTLDWLVRHIGR